MDAIADTILAVCSTMTMQTVMHPVITLHKLIYAIDYVFKLYSVYNIHVTSYISAELTYMILYIYLSPAQHIGNGDLLSKQSFPMLS